MPRTFEELGTEILAKLDKIGSNPVMPGRVTPESYSYFEGVRQDNPIGAARWNGLETRRKSYRMIPELEAVCPTGSVYKTFGHMLSDIVTRSHDFHPKYDKFRSAAKSALGLNSIDGADGGFMIFPEFSSAIADRVFDENNLWAMTDNYTVTEPRMTFPRSAETSRATGSRAGGVRAYWVDEGAEITASRPKIAETALQLHKLAVVVYLTDELMQTRNAVVLQQWVEKKVREEFTFMLGLALTSGTGVGSPLGYLASPGRVTVSKESGQAAATVVPDNILKMYSRRVASTPANRLQWLINQDIEPQLFKMSYGSGASVVYLPPGGLSSAPLATLMGIPVKATEFNKTLGTEGDIALVDLSQYVTINRAAIQQTESIHVAFLTDQTALKFTMYVDGRPMFDSPLTPLNGTATQSGFVTLETRS